MSCSCVLVDGGEWYETLVEIVFKATHRRECVECVDPIERGDFYEYYVGEKPGGGVFSCATCLTCVAVRDEFFCDGWIFGQIWADLAEHIEMMDWDEGVSEECLRSLPKKARFHVIDLIDEDFVMRNEEEERGLATGEHNR